MKSNTFQDAVESSAKVTGRKNVQVIFEGDQARTDGDVVYLPSMKQVVSGGADGSLMVWNFKPQLRAYR